MAKGDPPTLRQRLEFHVRNCRGFCEYCGSAYGADPASTTYDELDLASWIFGFCTNRCRKSAGEPEALDVEEALRVLFARGN